MRQQIVKQHARFCPVTFHSPYGNAEDGTDLLACQSAEETILDNPCETLVDDGEPVQRLVNLEQGTGTLVRRDDFIVERDEFLGAAPLGRESCACTIREDVAHRNCGYRQEMGAIAPLRSRLIDELEVCLVDEIRGRERIVSASCMLPVSDLTELAVEERRELVERNAVPAPEAVKNVVMSLSTHTSESRERACRVFDRFLVLQDEASDDLVTGLNMDTRATDRNNGWGGAGTFTVAVIRRC